MSESTRDPMPELTQYQSKLKEWGGWRADSRSVPPTLCPASTARVRPTQMPVASSAAFTDGILHLSKVTKKERKFQSALVFEITFLPSPLIRKAVTALDSTLEQNKRA